MTTLYRSVNGKERRYTIECIPSLFGEWIMIRTYGSSSKASPKGVVKTYYTNQEEAQDQIRILLHQKTNKGYRPLMNHKE